MCAIHLALGKQTHVFGAIVFYMSCLVLSRQMIADVVGVMQMGSFVYLFIGDKVSFFLSIR
jgi:hypothetical protein